ncbi:MAG: DUF1848 domain-containing protein [Rhodospirillaceae bacterium]|jgi:hypothetical protein|nr:DUF1848 domain-containing protein [Rhodospirillaceae bacterium]MBT5943950.1 DUF1848 domain-containing protein [Rhodospirillaceae bacterium]MBT6405525.1 DUF1848 domain-containing protein [Rhodospirillaceae bacterium]MBT6537004.1 DUF1848 domain-containing protein [Rhodospirillaceae bacterium]MBT7362965.1 DUF1848 domain-containing protein [Rhodospirillaceae bacterium]
MTIISASYKTDIPAFYGGWFRARRMAGSCEVRNAWNGKTFQVSLRDEDCSGFVFWTRNVKPFRDELDRTARTHPFVVQYTVTGYPRSLERSVVASDNAISDIQDISICYGMDTIVWRYDPVVITDATPVAWHIDNFTRLAGALAGRVDEVVVSFAQIYRKTRRNLDHAARETGNGWTDPDDAAKHDLLARLNDIAKQSGLNLSLCAQPALAHGLSAARCIDAARLDNVARSMGHAPVSARTKGARPGCLCAESRDIGGYETCPHGCVYCYAVGNPDKARQAHKDHDPSAAMLGPRTTPAPKEILTA